MEYTTEYQTELYFTVNSTTEILIPSSSELSIYVIIYIMVVFVPIGVVSIVGNAIVVFTIYRYPTLQVVRNYYLGSLAVADFLTGAIAVPGVIMHYVFVRRQFSNANLSDGVTMYVMPLFLFSWASIHNLLLITWDRYCALTQPLSYIGKSTKVRAFKYIAVAWIVSFIPILIPFFWGVERDLTSGIITIKGQANRIRNYICSFYFLIILTIMIKLHMSSYVIARKKEKELPGTMMLTRQNRPRKGTSELISVELHLKSFITITLVLVVFILSLTPLTILTYVEYIWDINIPVLVWFFEAIVFASSMVNPFIYACRRQDFRIAFRRTFKCKESKSNISNFDDFQLVKS
ncbi:adenosine receptor A3-like [Antedon mediterranea]|uniref:adenosine receptor A3-like n=1 Tax=Antedon mediterranea TaxID=105859 RepID=UPI003AF67FBB